MGLKIVNKNDPAFKEQQRQAWRRMSQNGKASFVLKRGLLFFGGVMFLVFAGLNAIALYATGHMEFLPILLMFNAILWSICGLAWGFWVWNKGEKLYSNSTAVRSATIKE
jgi:hypothetical protein